MGACGRPQFWFLEKILLDCEIWRKKFLRICYFSSTTLSICGMKSGQAFPFTAFEKLVKKFSVLLTCTHEATTLPESCVCLPLSLCLVSILLECNAYAHALLPLLLSPPSLPALTLTIPNLQVSACSKKGRENPQSQNVCMWKKWFDSVDGRKLDLGSKGYGFKSWQEWLGNFLLQGQLSVLTSYFSICFSPVLLQ